MRKIKQKSKTNHLKKICVIIFCFTFISSRVLLQVSAMRRWVRIVSNVTEANVHWRLMQLILIQVWKFWVLLAAFRFFSFTRWVWDGEKLSERALRAHIVGGCCASTFMREISGVSEGKERRKNGMSFIMILISLFSYYGRWNVWFSGIHIEIVWKIREWEQKRAKSLESLQA